MNPSELILLIVSILTSVGGQFFLKIGAKKLGRVDVKNALSHVASIVSTPELVFGLFFYALGAIAYILLLTRVKLSVAAPSVSLVYIFSVLISYFVFKESIPVNRILGLGFILLGVTLVVWEK